MGRPLKKLGMITEKEYLGKSLEDATEAAQNNGYEVRVIERDGNVYMLPMNVQNDRINFRLKNNIVIGVNGG